MLTMVEAGREKNLKTVEAFYEGLGRGKNIGVLGLISCDECSCIECGESVIEYKFDVGGDKQTMNATIKQTKEQTETSREINKKLILFHIFIIVSK